MHTWTLPCQFAVQSLLSDDQHVIHLESVERVQQQLVSLPIHPTRSQGPRRRRLYSHHDETRLKSSVF